LPGFLLFAKTLEQRRSVPRRVAGGSLPRKDALRDFRATLQLDPKESRAAAGVKRCEAKLSRRAFTEEEARALVEIQGRIKELQKQMARERITWRDPDIIQHYRAANGYILPRRLTKLSRRKQQDLVKAVRIGQQMALIPFDWNSSGSETVPLMDPVQWMSDRLSRRVEKGNDGKKVKGEIRNARAAAMMSVLSKQESVNTEYFDRLQKKSEQPQQQELSFEQKLKQTRQVPFFHG
jgi:ribosomal protein S18